MHMRNAHLFVRVALCLISTMLALPALTSAQGGPAKLVGRAVLPAETLADGPKSGAALASRQIINGIKVPFDSQPVGNITAILPGDYQGTWIILTNGGYDKKENSGDYLLRIYTVEIDLHRANGGDGTVNVLDWRTLADPSKKIKQAIKNANQPTRELTGADFDPRAFYRSQDGTFWIAEAYKPSLLHFNAKGLLLTAPINLDGAGVLQGLGAVPNSSTLIVAQRDPGNNSQVVFRPFDMNARSIGAPLSSYKLENSANNVSDLVMINIQQAVVIEEDSQQNKNAQFKRVYLADLGANPATKTLLADLLNIADPDNISTSDVFAPTPNAFGLGSPFKFPFADVSAVYPIDAQTLMAVNDNNVPLGVGRSSSKADDTEYIAIQLAQPLNLGK